MKLISCEDCGVVIDLDQIEHKFEMKEINEFNRKRVVICPVCKNVIHLEKA